MPNYPKKYIVKQAAYHSRWAHRLAALGLLATAIIIIWVTVEQSMEVGEYIFLFIKVIAGWSVIFASFLFGRMCIINLYAWRCRQTKVPPHIELIAVETGILFDQEKSEPFDEQKAFQVIEHDNPSDKDPEVIEKKFEPALEDEPQSEKLDAVENAAKKKVKNTAAQRKKRAHGRR